MKFPSWSKRKNIFVSAPQEQLLFRHLRLFLMIIMVALLYAALLLNFYHLQIERGAYYSSRSAAVAAGAYFAPPRGSIYFRDKDGASIPAALNKMYSVIFAVPKEIEDPAEAAGLLKDALGLDDVHLKTVLEKSSDLYELLIKKATPAQVEAAQKLGLRGVYADVASYRFYPFKDLASQLIGFVGSAADDTEVGRYGIESFYETVLAGHPGSVSGGTVARAVSGADIMLTIDRNIQARAEEILTAMAEAHKAERGTIIVENPKTGEILALANYPNFDPNNYSKSPLAIFLNHATSALYEPGSILKVLTMVAGLDAGKLTPDTRFYDPGFLTLNGKTVRNWDLKSHGSVTMTEVIEQSINTGAAYAERLLGHNQFYKYLKNFGLNEKTGIDLPGEVAGNLRNLEKKAEDINFATASYGQGISVTPMELATAFSAIANGGLLMRPYITVDKSPSIIRRVISSEAAKKVTAMMVSAVDKAEVAHIPRYAVAGKTGTAQVPDFKIGGYTHDVINSYAGFAPVADPKFVILIKLDKPAGAPLAGATVVPAFRDLTEFLLNYYNIAPDR